MKSSKYRIYKQLLSKSKFIHFLQCNKLKRNKNFIYYTTSTKYRFYIELNDDIDRSKEILNNIFNNTLYFTHYFNLDGSSFTFTKHRCNILSLDIYRIPNLSDFYIKINENSILFSYFRHYDKYRDIDGDLEKIIFMIKSL